MNRVSQIMWKRWSSSSSSSKKTISSMEVQRYLESSQLESVSRSKIPVVSVDSNATLKEAMVAMRKNRVGSVIVMHDHNSLGIFTEHDVLEKVVFGGLDAKREIVKNHMTSSVVVGSPNMSVAHGMRLLLDNNIHHLPIATFIGSAIDNDTRITDVLSSHDMLKFLLEYKQ